jgi:hypothetical protein
MCLKHLSFYKQTERYIIIYVYRTPLKYRYYCHILNKLNFSTEFRKIFKYQIPWKSLQGEPSCFMLIDGQTDITKRYSLFFQYSHAHEILHCYTQVLITWCASSHDMMMMIGVVVVWTVAFTLYLAIIPGGVEVNFYFSLTWAVDWGGFCWRNHQNLQFWEMRYISVW